MKENTHNTNTQTHTHTHTYIYTHIRLLNEEFEWNKKNLNLKSPIIGPHSQTDEESVRNISHKMKQGKASGTSGVVSEMLLAPGDAGIERITNLFNKIIAEKKVLEDWDTNIRVSLETVLKIREMQLNEETTEG